MASHKHPPARKKGKKAPQKKTEKQNATCKSGTRDTSPAMKSATSGISVRTARILLILSVACMLLFSLTVLFMPFTGNQLRDGIQTPTLIVGSLFWGAILIASLLQILLAVRRPPKFDRSQWNKKLPKPLRFNRTSTGLVVFMLWILALAGLITSLILTNYHGFICYVFLSILIFLSQMLFVCNGKIFEYVTQNK